MGFLDRAKKLAGQAVEKAEPLIDRAAPHAGKVVDRAGEQIDKRTGRKYHDRIEAVEAKVGEFAEKRAAAKREHGETVADAGPEASPPTTASEAAGPSTAAEPSPRTTPGEAAGPTGRGEAAGPTGPSEAARPTTPGGPSD